MGPKINVGTMEAAPITPSQANEWVSSQASHWIPARLIHTVTLLTNCPVQNKR